MKSELASNHHGVLVTSDYVIDETHSFREQDQLLISLAKFGKSKDYLDSKRYI
jgi:hypothetical protein